MSFKTLSCSCQSNGVTAANAENEFVIENPSKSESTTNFEITRFKPLKERLLDSNKHPTFTYKYFEEIKETLRESCDFDHIKEALYYLERNPDIYDIVPRLLEFISCELKKESQQRAPILLKALYCLYTNSVSAVSDFSVCTNALEHYLTKSSAFPGDYVLKDIAADILSDFCAMSPSDDLKEHLIFQLSHVFHNTNLHSYNLYGGIVGCLSNMSVKSGPEVVPCDKFYSKTFLRNVLSSPKMLRKLFYLCKPFIYSCLPSMLIPMPLHNKNSFYDVNTRYADVFNLMRNEVITPISSVKYDHKFSDDYGWWWSDDAKRSNVPANRQDCDSIWPGFSAYQKQKMLQKNTDSEERERSLQIDSSYVKNLKKEKYPVFDRKIDYTNRWLNTYGGYACSYKCSQSEMNPLTDRESDDWIENTNEIDRPGGLFKHDIQSDFSKDNTDGSKSEGKGNSDSNKNEEFFLTKNKRKLLDLSQTQLQASVKKIDWKCGDNMDTIDNENNPHVDSEDNGDSFRRKMKKMEIIRESDSKAKRCDNECSDDSSESNESENNFQIYYKSKSDEDNSESEENLQTNKDGDDENLQISGKFKGDIKSSKSEESLLIETNSDLNSSKTEWNSFIGCEATDMDIMDIDEVKNFQDENKSIEYVSSVSERSLQVDSKSDGDSDVTESESNLQDDSKSSDDMDASIITVVNNERDLISNRLGKGNWEPPLKHTEPIKAKIVRQNPDHHEESRSSEYIGFRNYEEYSAYQAWKREGATSEFHRYNKIGETLKLIPPPSYIDKSIFEHREEDFVRNYLVPHSHVISSQYLSEESVKVGEHCCEKSNTCANPSGVCSSPPDLDIFKNLDKNIFAKWEFKKPKNKKEPPGADKSDTKSQVQKKCKTRGKKR